MALCSPIVIHSYIPLVAADIESLLQTISVEKSYCQIQLFIRPLLTKHSDCVFQIRM